ncbi:MAG: Hpt domain-containing protein [Deltaproteobacteria bacterium]|nr:Hpt domain-containing protein [Deltaproteobacteria bacterium]
MKNSNSNQGEKIVVHVDADLEDLIPGFLENRQKDIKSMLETLKQGDYETIRILGHSMKGAGGGYGFDAITEIGASLEQSAKDKNAEEIRKKIDELSTYLEHVEVRYE